MYGYVCSVLLSMWSVSVLDSVLVLAEHWSSRVQKQAARTLFTLSSSADIRDQIIQHGGIEYVMYLTAIIVCGTVYIYMYMRGFDVLMHWHGFYVQVYFP